MYVVDGWSSAIVAHVNHVCRSTVLNYVHDVLTYKEPEAEVIRRTIRAAQAKAKAKREAKPGRSDSSKGEP